MRTMIRIKAGDLPALSIVLMTRGKTTSVERSETLFAAMCRPFDPCCAERAADAR